MWLNSICIATGCSIRQFSLLWIATSKAIKLSKLKTGVCLVFCKYVQVYYAGNVEKTFNQKDKKLNSRLTQAL